MCHANVWSFSSFNRTWLAVRNCLTFDTPEMIRVLRFVGVFRATLDSVSCRMAVSATGSNPFERRLLPERGKKETNKYVNTHRNRSKRENAFKKCLCECVKVSSFLSVRGFIFSSVTLRRSSVLILLCICYVKRDPPPNSLLELGLPLTSDSTTGFFSVTSTLDGERRGDSPVASEKLLSPSSPKSAGLASPPPSLTQPELIPLDYYHFCRASFPLSISIYRQVLMRLQQVHLLQYQCGW